MRILMFFMLSLLIWANDDSAGSPESSGTPVQVTAVWPSQTESAVITLQIQPGYHINSNKPNQDFLIPTSLESANPAVLLTDVVYPAGSDIVMPFSSDKISVYSDKPVITARFFLQGISPQQIELLLNIQACNDKECLAPQKLPVTLKVP